MLQSMGLPRVRYDLVTEQQPPGKPQSPVNPPAAFYCTALYGFKNICLFPVYLSSQQFRSVSRRSAVMHWLWCACDSGDIAVCLGGIWKPILFTGSRLPCPMLLPCPKCSLGAQQPYSNLLIL